MRFERFEKFMVVVQCQPIYCFQCSICDIGVLCHLLARCRYRQRQVARNQCSVPTTTNHLIHNDKYISVPPVLPPQLNSKRSRSSQTTHPGVVTGSLEVASYSDYKVVWLTAESPSAGWTKYKDSIMLNTNKVAEIWFWSTPISHITEIFKTTR